MVKHALAARRVVAPEAPLDGQRLHQVLDDLVKVADVDVEGRQVLASSHVDAHLLLDPSLIRKQVDHVVQQAVQLGSCFRVHLRVQASTLAGRCQQLQKCPPVSLGEARPCVAVAHKLQQPGDQIIVGGHRRWRRRLRKVLRLSIVSAAGRGVVFHVVHVRGRRVGDARRACTCRRLPRGNRRWSTFRVDPLLVALQRVPRGKGWDPALVARPKACHRLHQRGQQWRGREEWVTYSGR